jgi:thiamine-monophosphate kinase
VKPEDRLVERLRREVALALLPPGDFVRIGIGDDAAVLTAAKGDTAATTDVLVEGVDFLPGEDPETIGRRAVAVNLSDLAAVGAAPRWFLLTVGFPASLGEDGVFAICRGAAERGREYGAALCGGDLSASPSLFVSVAMVGELQGAPLTRSGARAGDLLYLSGATGRAAAGLAIARDGAPPGLSPATAGPLLAAYRDPRPPVDLGRELSRNGLATAAIDVSDGLGVDAGRLARASGARLVLEAARIPIAAELVEFGARSGADVLGLAVGGGDDYELLFTVPAALASKVESLASAGAGVVRIGLVEEGSGAVLRTKDGDRDVSLSGWDHVEASR